MQFGKRGGVVHISREATHDDILKKVCKVNEPKKTVESVDGGAKRNGSTPQQHPSNGIPTPPKTQEEIEEENLLLSIGAKRTSDPIPLSIVNPEYELSYRAVYLKDRKARAELRKRGLEYYAFTRNCQRCVPTWEANRRGWLVTALPKISKDKLSHFWMSIWKRQDLIELANWPDNPMKEQIEKIMKGWGDGARAEISVSWKGSNSGHVFVAEQRTGETFFINQQSNDVDCSSYFTKVAGHGWQQGILRIDNNEFSDVAKECFTRISNTPS